VKARDLWETDLLRGLACRIGTAVPHHGERLAHLRRLGADPRQQSVLGNMFLDDTACTFASINLLTFRDPKTKNSTSRATSTPSASGPSVLEISVLMGAVSKQADRAALL